MFLASAGAIGISLMASPSGGAWRAVGVLIGVAGISAAAIYAQRELLDPCGVSLEGDTLRFEYFDGRVECHATADLRTARWAVGHWWIRDYLLLWTIEFRNRGTVYLSGRSLDAQSEELFVRLSKEASRR